MPGDSGSRPGDCKSAYDQLYASYRATGDFRTSLLGLLPLATGAGLALGSASDARQHRGTGPDLAGSVARGRRARGGAPVGLNAPGAPARLPT